MDRVEVDLIMIENDQGILLHKLLMIYYLRYNPDDMNHLLLAFME